jgi:hypothetical protein
MTKPRQPRSDGPVVSYGTNRASPLLRNIWKLVVAFSAILTILVGCGPPPGLEAAWVRYKSAQSRYESCALQYHRQVAACNAEGAAFQTERENYYAAVGSQRSTTAR